MSNSSSFEMDAKEPLAGKSSETSPSKVQFISSSPDEKNGEAKVDIGRYDGVRVGLTKEELMKYASDPFWVRVRLISFILFWVAWWATLIGSTVIIFLAPKCADLKSMVNNTTSSTLDAVLDMATKPNVVASNLISSMS